MIVILLEIVFFMSFGIISAKRSRMDTVSVTNNVTGNTMRIQKSTGFGQLIAGEAISIRSNLPQHRRDVAMTARDFLAKDVCQAQNFGGLKAIPWGLDVELSNSPLMSEQKYVSVRFAMNMSEEPSAIVVGKTPVEIKVGLRKGHFVQQNKTTLGLTFDAWSLLLQHGRQFIKELTALEGQSFDSFEDVVIPQIAVIREIPADGFEHRQNTVVLLTVSLAKKSNADNICAPVINIREYAEDVKNQCFVPTQKGVGLGLKALYMLVYPVAFAARKMHDLLLSVKVGMDEFRDSSQKQLEEMQNRLKKTGGVWTTIDEKDDELTKDQRSVIGTESILNDDVNDGLDVINIGDLESDALAAIE
jgi:hypothetical protein